MISKQTRTFALLSVLTLVSWIFIELYKVNRESNVPTPYLQNSTPLSEDLDVEFLKSLQNRLSF